MNWIQPNGLQRMIYPDALWRMDAGEKNIYLTFDDGPTPDVTEWVLATLETWHAKATFFCIGKNVVSNEALFQKVKLAGHSIGNHTFSHEKGWTCELTTYLKSAEACQQLVSSDYFRPPYGKMSIAQYLKLRKRYKIVMWDVLTYDYDQTVPATYSLNQSISKTRNGSIVVFHDSVKSFPKLKKMLPLYLHHFTQMGFVFKALSSETVNFYHENEMCEFSNIQ